MIGIRATPAEDKTDFPDSSGAQLLAEDLGSPPLRPLQELHKCPKTDGGGAKMLCITSIHYIPWILPYSVRSH